MCSEITLHIAPSIALDNPCNYNRLDDADDLDDPFSCKGCPGNATVVWKIIKRPWRVRSLWIFPLPRHPSHRYTDSKACVRGSETGTKLPKIYINLYLLNLLLNSMLVSGSGWRVFLGTRGGFETFALGSCLFFG